MHSSDPKFKLLVKLQNLDTHEELHYGLIKKAIYWIKKYYGGRCRKNGAACYTHPLGVAYIVSDYLLQTDVIVSSILHDIMDNTEVTLDMIIGNFGYRIAEMVDMLTYNKLDGTQLSIQDILYNAYQKNDKEVLLIKCIDRLHNIKTIEYHSTDQQLHTCSETLKNFLLLTESLGFHQISKQIYTACHKLNTEFNITTNIPTLGQESTLPPPAHLIFENN